VSQAASEYASWLLEQPVSLKADCRV